MNPFLATDGYKTSHMPMYPDGTGVVYNNFTPRTNKRAPNGTNQVAVFGSQMAVRQIKKMFDRDFFNLTKEQAVDEIKREYSMYLGFDYDVSHIEALHDLGYLPIKIKSLPEGTFCPIGVPVITLYNTHPDFFWLPNFLETLISNLLWKPMTSATIASQYKRVLDSWAYRTDKGNMGFVPFQGHDFSMRGLDSMYATMSSGLGHASFFLGSDSLPVIHGARKYYDEKEAVVFSVPATEHSVMCAGTKEDELTTFKRLMNIFPKGILSVVSDTWDLWNVITNILPKLKEEILARDGKLVIRPDSGDPVDIICGYNWDVSQYNDKGKRKLVGTPEHKGVIELLWDIFGGTINEQGYKVLDSHIGAIYGDAITIERAEEICKRLQKKGFASTNIVLGIGSFTYQFNTRDNLGFAMKATYVEVNGKGLEIFKDPVTDAGMKKSAKGLLKVELNEQMGLPQYELVQGVTWEEESKGALQTIFEDGKFYNETTLTEIRKRFNGEN